MRTAFERNFFLGQKFTVEILNTGNSVTPVKCLFVGEWNAVARISDPELKQRISTEPFLFEVRPDVLDIPTLQYFEEWSESTLLYGTISPRIFSKKHFPETKKEGARGIQMQTHVSACRLLTASESSIENDCPFVSVSFVMLAKGMSISSFPITEDCPLVK